MTIPAHIRRKIADFDPVKDGQTITAFCKEHKISRQTYHNIKARVAERGRKGLLPDSTAPKKPAHKYNDNIRTLVRLARMQLREQGRDNGPWSIYYYLIDELGIEDAPQRSTIASWLHHDGLADANARKRPRSSYRRFARGLANELWQIDAVVYRLFDSSHTKITIYQVIDDATRLDVGTQAFTAPENGPDARTTLAEAMQAYGKPQEVLSDNGEAFATYHKGHLSATEKWLAQLGVWSIAGFAPTTQGKDERSHQTLTRFLDARHPTSLKEVQNALVEYREFYNTRRRHQGLVHGKTHLTPAQAWDLFDHAAQPTEPIDPDVLLGKIMESYQRMDLGADDPRMQKALEEVAASTKAHGDNDQWATHESRSTDSSTVASTPDASSATAAIPDQVRVTRYGVVNVSGYALYVGYRWKDRLLYTHVTEDKAEFFTAHDGELLFSFPLPIHLTKRPAGKTINIRYVKGWWHRNPPRLNKSHTRTRRARK